MGQLEDDNVGRALELKMASRAEDVVLASTAIRAVLALLYDGDTLNQLELALVEAINNVIEHAYSGESGHSLSIRLELLHDRVEIKLTDSGQGMNWAKLNRTKTVLDFDENDLCTLPEGGLGIAIMQMTMDDVRYERKDGVNQLTLMRYRP